LTGRKDSFEPPSAFHRRGFNDLDSVQQLMFALGEKRLLPARGVLVDSGDLPLRSVDALVAPF
jgi:hypothetical protein